MEAHMNPKFLLIQEDGKAMLSTTKSNPPKVIACLEIHPRDYDQLDQVWDDVKLRNFVAGLIVKTHESTFMKAMGTCPSGPTLITD